MLQMCPFHSRQSKGRLPLAGASREGLGAGASGSALRLGLSVYAALIDDDRRENAFGLLMGLNMLIETPGGFDFAGRDCQGWMRAAGFHKTWVEHLVGPHIMVISL